MTKKLKIVSITGLFLLGVGILGGGIGIGLAIDSGVEQSKLNEQKRNEIIRQRTFVNNLVFSEFRARDKNDEMYKDYVWKPEYANFLNDTFYPPETNININSDWYYNYGPFYLSDFSEYSGKLVLSGFQSALPSEYSVTQLSSDSNKINIIYYTEIYELTTPRPDGKWNGKMVYPIFAKITIDENF